MLARKDKHEKIAPAALVAEAQALHEALINFSVPPRAVPAEVLRLYEMHKRILKNDQQAFKVSDLQEPYAVQEESKTLFAILNKIVNYSHLSDHDLAAVQKIELPEAIHIREYLSFQREMMTYLHFIREYLLQLRKELKENKIIIHVGDEDKEYPRFFNNSNGVQKLKAILSDIDSECLPKRVLQTYQKVADVLYGIKESRFRHTLNELFYLGQLNEIKSFSFIPPEMTEVDQLERDVEKQAVENVRGKHL